MDGAKIGDGQYTCRSERELEPYMECFWYLDNKIPSLYTPGAHHHRGNGGRQQDQPH